MLLIMNFGCWDMFCVGDGLILFHVDFDEYAKTRRGFWEDRGAVYSRTDGWNLRRGFITGTVNMIYFLVPVAIIVKGSPLC